MICPNCATDLTAEHFPVNGTLGVCPSCARSLVLDGETVRLATSADTAHLSDADVTLLRKARPKAWRETVLATKARIKGR